MRVAQLQQTREETNGAVKVAFVSPAWPPGSTANGVVTYTGLMVGALQALGQRPYVVTKSRNSGGEGDFVVSALGDAAKRPYRARLLDYLGYRLAPRGWGQWRLINFLAARVNRLARERGVELLEIEEALGLARRLASRIPIPIVVRLHGPWFLNGRAQGVKQNAAFTRRVRWEGLAIQRAAGMSAPSLDVLRRVRDHYGLALPDAVVIPNPICPVPAKARWSLDGCSRNRILFVGRFDRHKGGDTIIDAFERLAREHSDCRLTFVGPDRGFVDEGERQWFLAHYVKQRIGDPTIRARCEWLGFRSAEQIVELRQRAMVTVVCSRYEVFGLTATEAMSTGCPLIVSGVGGLREIVEHGRNGLHCRAGDPDDLAQKILLLLRNPKLAGRLGRQAAMDTERRYHPQVIAKQTLHFYQRVIERANSRKRGVCGRR